MCLCMKKTFILLYFNSVLGAEVSTYILFTFKLKCVFKQLLRYYDGISITVIIRIQLLSNSVDNILTV